MFRPGLGITRGNGNTRAMLDGADRADDTLENGMGYLLESRFVGVQAVQKQDSRSTAHFVAHS